MVTMHGISISFSFSRERVRTYMRNPKKQVDVQADSRDWDRSGQGRLLRKDERKRLL